MKGCEVGASAAPEIKHFEGRLQEPSLPEHLTSHQHVLGPSGQPCYCDQLVDGVTKRGRLPSDLPRSRSLRSSYCLWHLPKGTFFTQWFLPLAQSPFSLQKCTQTFLRCHPGLSPL